MNKVFLLLVLIFLFSCETGDVENTIINKEIKPIEGVSLVLLGTIQDAGSPHIACKKDCCARLFEKPDINRQVISMGLVDNISNKKYLFDATPDISTQLKALKKYGKNSEDEFVNGIFLTHAHIGHYAGLMYLGKEATDAKEIEVYTMPRMKNYLETNGPWDQLVKRKNIILTELEDEKGINLLEDKIRVIPFLVPHRDEYSETVGYKIIGPNKSALFIPDIDKWGKWEKSIIEEVSKVDYAFLDATFYDGKEINNRDITQIPHPFVIESMKLFKDLPKEEKDKIIFIHFNHTNPIIDSNSQEARTIKEAGFNVGEIHKRFEI